MFRLIWKQAVARRGRFALTVVAVTIGVAFVVGALVLTDTSQKVFDDQFATATTRVDLTVRDAAAFDSAMGVEVDRDPLPSAALDTVARIPGVERAVPVVRGSGLLIRDGRAIVPRGPSMLASWVPDGLNGFSLRTGRAPEADTDVVVDVATARAEGIRVGDRLTVQSNTTGRLTVTGLVGFGDNDGLPNTTVALITLGAAQELVDVDRDYTEVLVVADAGEDTGRLRDAVSGALGSAYDVSAARDTAAASAAAARNQLAFLRVTLFVLAGAAVLVGGFLIANTFAIVVTQRIQELALLRAAGATGRQVFWSVLGEAGLVGLAGGLTGAVAGIAAAAGLRGLAGSVGIPIPDGELVVLPRTLLLGVLIGVVVTLVAAVVPGRRAARTSPVAAMRGGDTVTARRRRRTLTGLVVAPLRRLGVPGRMAAESAARSPRRTAATMTALALSLGLVVFTGALASSVKASIAATYSEVVTADFVVESSRGEMLGGLTHEVHHAVMDLPEVGVVSRLQYGHWKEGDVTRALTAVEPDTLSEVTDLDLVAGSLEDLVDGGIVLSDKAAADRGLGVGDRLEMTFAKDGRRSLPVVGLVADDDAQALSTDFFISTATYADLYAERMDATLFIEPADGVAPAVAARALRDAIEPFPTAEVRDQQEAVDGRMLTVDQILGLVTVLLMFTVLIAMLGITNTLALSIVERTREIGLLRAVGMTGRQVGRMIRAEALLVAAVSLVLAVVLGALTGGLAVQAIGGGGVALRLPYAQLGVVLVAATVTGLLAGLVPARRAARTDVLSAIATP